MDWIVVGHCWCVHDLAQDYPPLNLVAYFWPKKKEIKEIATPVMRHYIYRERERWIGVVLLNMSHNQILLEGNESKSEIMLVHVYDK